MFEKPLYKITDETVNLIAGVSALLPMISPKAAARLRKDRNIRSVHSSLAIENNTLSLKQVADVINGNEWRVAYSPREIPEVKNAFAAYSQSESLDPFAISEFLGAHKLMMKELADDAGKFRGADAYDGDKPVLSAPKAEFVRGHIESLFAWAKESAAHPLIKSSVVHYEIERIRPFIDGNARMGRLWQTVILSKWDPLFLALPIETILFEQQSDYCAALASSDKAGDATAFIEFMLTAITDMLVMRDKREDKREDKRKDKQGNEHEEELSETMLSVLRAIEHVNMSRKEIFVAIGMNGDIRAFRRSVKPLLVDGYVEMTVPDKPNSKLQKYRLTEKGKATIR